MRRCNVIGCVLATLALVVPPRTLAAQSASRGAAPESRPVVMLRGRCLDAAGDEPIAGCTIHVAVRDGIGCTWWNRELDLPAPIRSGSDGRFAGAVGDASNEFIVTVRQPGWIRRELYVASGASSEYAAGDIRLERSCDIRGRVIDERGNGVAHALVSFNGCKLFPDVECDAEGRFVYDSRLGQGDYRVEICGPIHRLVAPAVVRLLVTGSPYDVPIRVRRVPALRGAVVDEGGAPVGEGVPVVALAQGWGDPVANGLTDRKGRFELYAEIDEAPPVAVTIAATDRWSPPPIGTAANWHGEGVVVRVRRPAAVVLRVVASGTDQPIEWFSAWRFRAASPESHADRNPSLHPEGRCRVAGLSPGPNEIVVTAASC